MINPQKNEGKRIFFSFPASSTIQMRNASARQIWLTEIETMEKRRKSVIAIGRKLANLSFMLLYLQPREKDDSTHREKTQFPLARGIIYLLTVIRKLVQLFATIRYWDSDYFIFP